MLRKSVLLNIEDIEQSLAGVGRESCGRAVTLVATDLASPKTEARESEQGSLRAFQIQLIFSAKSKEGAMLKMS